MGRFDGKTEKATPQARDRARKEGTVAKSQEVAVASSLLAVALTLQAFGPRGIASLADETRFLFTTAGGQLPLAEVGASLGRMVTSLMVPVLVVATFAALASGVGQVGLKITPKAAKPKLSHLSPKKGLQRLAPSKAAWELLRTGVKLGALLLLVWTPLRTWSERSAGMGLDAGLGETLDEAWALLVRSVVLAMVIACADYAWNRHRTGKELRMSKEDVRREHKDNDGDPLIQSQRRRRQQELSRNRMLSGVSTADVVVTNPTHLAVALRYGEGEAAPRVVAKGADKLAAKIRAEAYRHGVHVTQDRPLARALYRQCKLGQYVPAALYEAVAVVLALAYRQRGLLAPAGRSS